MKTQTIALTIAATFVFCLGTPVPPTDDEPWLNYDPSSDTPSNSGSSQSGSSSSSSSGSSSSSSSDQSSSSSSSDSSSNSVQVIGYSFSDGRELISFDELPARPGDFQDIFIRQPEGPGNFQDAFIRHLQQQEQQQQQPDFLPNAPTGDEMIFVDESPETIQIYVEDQPSLPSTSTGRRGGQGPPTGRPEACLKKRSEEQEAGPSPKKPKTKNIGKSIFLIKNFNH